MTLPALLLLLALAVQDAGTAPPVRPVPSPAPPADATTAATSAASSADDPSASAPLAEDEVARVGGIAIPWSEFRRYVGTVFVRHPEGDEALRRQVVREVSHALAAELGLTVSDVDVARLSAEILERAAAASPDGKAPPEVAADLARPELRRSLADLALQRELVRHDDGLAPDAEVSDERVQAFVQATYDGAHVVEHPLDDPVAATYDGGQVGREALGEEVLELLPEKERAGVLTELIGIVLVQRKAAQLGVTFAPEVAVAELEDRAAYVASNPTAQGLTYDDVLDKVDHRTREELVASPAFIAQVLLRQMVDLRWDDDKVRELWTAERAQTHPGTQVDWEAERHAAWRVVRQRTYQQLFAECTIRRRF
ncbi:MAG: hypothetical protein H6825_15480 [Planctomycetes bacterium]|nr:hypothetical protein [Planctomycetota bacterium]